MKRGILKSVAIAALPAAALGLAGCFAVPNANVQPKGNPGLIQSGLVIESVKDPATVTAIDGGLRTQFGGYPTFKNTDATPPAAETGQRSITVRQVDGATITYPVDPAIKHADEVKVGDVVKLTVTEELAVYVLQNGQAPGASGAPETIVPDARVLKVDPSYRLLSVQYPDGRTETFKAGLDARLLAMEPGDAVVMRPSEVTAMRLMKP